jgi:hypothetical protein
MHQSFQEQNKAQFSKFLKNNNKTTAHTLETVIKKTGKSLCKND